MMSVAAFNAAVPVHAPPPPLDGNVELLKGMFPEVDVDTLSVVLGHHSGDVQRAIDALLDSTAALPDASNVDADMARNIQLEQDEEMAKAVQASLEEEARAEEERRKAQDPLVQASKAAAIAADKTKAFGASLMQKMRQAQGRKPPSELHGARLLEAPLEVSSDAFRPIANYAPPTVADMMMPMAAPPANPAMAVDVSDAPAPPPPAAPPAQPLMAPAPPLLQHGAPANTANRYSSRVDRARNANQQKRVSISTAAAAPEPLIADLAPLSISPTYG